MNAECGIGGGDIPHSAIPQTPWPTDPGAAGSNKTLQRIQKATDTALSRAKQSLRFIRCFLHPL